MLGKIASIRDSLTRTRQTVFGRVATLLGQTEITPETWDELEALLIQADMGVDTTLFLLERLQAHVKSKGLTQTGQLQDVLKVELRVLLGEATPMSSDEARPLSVIVIIGVNGSGKTTSIAKLAAYYKQRGRSVLLAGADTFRAAAGEQIDIWAERAGVPLVGGTPGADPAAIVFDAIKAAQARKVDLVIADTAGRLHTKYNLMQELAKVCSVAAKALPGAPHETLVVIDATTGQNALTQARLFRDAVKASGVIVTKLDGTAKGGMIFSITNGLGLPVRFIGTGEKMGDMAEFDAQAFVDGLFD
ncbi:MAG: signal recognition particle-docking protein FtsY [Thermoflexales bacterium]|nr:signal recognition particle-docking protein FtsY [Thermoflexales bacterium]